MNVIVLLIKILGVLILSMNLVLDYSYIFLSTFSSTTILGVYGILLVVRLLISFTLAVRGLMYKVNEPLDINDGQSGRSNQSA